MKLIVPLLFLALFSCTAIENKSDGQQDSTALLSDTAKVVQQDSTARASYLPEDYFMASDDTSSAGQLFSLLKDSIETLRNRYLEVNISSDQYEASSDVTWYFDSAMNPVYYYERWSSEGSEGMTERIIKENQVVCVSMAENSTSEKWCREVGGVRVEHNESEGDDIVTILDNAYSAGLHQSFNDDLGDISSFIREAEIVEDGEEWLVLRIQEVVNYGGEHTETAEMRIPREVYDVYR
ncbi:MAG TPA: hypothetical protein VGD40_09480 [Chryseosolibacter sp.]